MSNLRSQPPLKLELDSDEVLTRSSLDEVACVRYCFLTEAA